MKPKVAVLYAPGTNCHEETVSALKLAGAQAEIVNIFDLIDKKVYLRNYPALAIPGGFSWGDHLGAGRIFAIYLMAYLKEELLELSQKQVPIIGICNGYQVLVESGLLPAGRLGIRQAVLVQNRSARFESRWVKLLGNESHCIWTEGLIGQIIRLPVAHGEGRLQTNESIFPVFYYSKDGKPTEEYPFNPSGSPGGLAGICDQSGKILGMMPHPERAVFDWQGSTDGRVIFKNLVRYLKN